MGNTTSLPEVNAGTRGVGFTAGKATKGRVLPSYAIPVRDEDVPQIFTALSKVS